MEPALRLLTLVGRSDAAGEAHQGRLVGPSRLVVEDLGQSASSSELDTRGIQKL